MSKGKMIAILVGASLLLSSVFASAQPCRPGPFFRHPELAKKMELTDKQIDQIKDLFLDMEKKRIELRADLQLKELELRQAMDSPKPDEGKVRKLVKQIGTMKTDLHMTRIDQQLGLKKILTPEQQEKLRQFRMMGGMREMKEMRKMRQGKCEQRKPCKHHQD